MLAKRLLSSTITTSCSPFTYTHRGENANLPSEDARKQNRLSISVKKKVVAADERRRSLSRTAHLDGEDALRVTVECYGAEAGNLCVVAAERFQHLGEDAGLLAEDLEVVLVRPQRCQLHQALQIRATSCVVWGIGVAMFELEVVAVTDHFDPMKKALAFS
jgi:hypothetical protein